VSCPPPIAARLLAASSTLRRETGLFQQRLEREPRERTLAAVRSSLDERELEEAFSTGARLSPAEAVEYARASIDSL
jgi:hypothetical protein